MNVVPEGGSLLYHDLDDDHRWPHDHRTLAAGRALYQDIIGLLAKTKVAYTPTLIVGFGGLSGEYFWYERDNVWEHKRLLTFVPRDVVDARSRRRIKAAGDDDFNHVSIAKQREAARRRRRDDQHGRARAAAGPGRALGDLDAGAGRHEPARRAPHRHDQRRRNRSASTRSWDRSRPASSPTSSCSTATRSRTSATPTRCRW